LHQNAPFQSKKFRYFSPAPLVAFGHVRGTFVRPHIEPPPSRNEIPGYDPVFVCACFVVVDILAFTLSPFFRRRQNRDFGPK